MPPLTRTEAEERARLLTVHAYEIDLDLTRGEEVFGSRARIRFSAREPGAETFIEIRSATVHRAALNGRELDPATLHDGRLPLDALAVDNELLVEADMRYSRTGEGLHRFTDPTDGETYTYSQSCLDDAQRIYACFDQPDLKATFAITVTAPPGWTVLGNGNSTRDPANDGRWRIATTPPISTYLAAIAAGPYHSIRSAWRGLPLGLHCRRSLAPHLDADAEELIDLTRRCLDHYHHIFDEPYPFDSYDQAFVPEFNAGAMENPGLVIFRDQFVFRSAVTDTQRLWRAVVIAHEMAHMWFGDLVTMTWWDDLWLNESFAEYMGYQTASLATRHHGTWAAFAAHRKPWGYDADQRPSTHPVAPEADDVPDTASALNNFDGISYAKGASALRQLVAWLGEKTFLAGVNDHFARHRFGNADLADFLDSLARAADNDDRDVHAWAARWLRTPGVDTLHVGTTQDGHIRITREAGNRPHRITIGRYEHASDPSRLRPAGQLHADLPADTHHLELEPPIAAAQPTLLIPNDDDLTYCKTRLDDHAWTAVTRSLGAVPSPLSRAVLWTEARDRLRDGELPARDYLGLVTRHLPTETDVSVIEPVLTYARRTVADTYLRPEHRAEALTALGTLSRTLTQRAADTADTGLQLAATRTLIDCAITDEHARELDQWLTLGAIPGGPEPDAELRWNILLRLTVLGAADERRITAELHRDPSSTGEEAAARCRAALPTTDTKNAAWHALYEDDTLSNYLVTATAQGFWQPEQHAVLDNFTLRWFDAAKSAATRRGTAVASALVREGFPSYAAEEAVLRAGEACLAYDDLSPAFRRWLADRLDDLRRAITVRARG